MDLADRLWSGVAIGAPDECWPWGRAVDGGGYGSIWVDGRCKKAHRVAYELRNGAIPDGADLDHECHNRAMSCPGGKTCPHRRCCNPAHLRPTTHRDNVLAGRGIAADHARNAFCSAGHALVGENVLWTGPDRRWRRCAICRRAQQLAAYYRRRSAST